MSEVKKDLKFKHFRENPKEYWDKEDYSLQNKEKFSLVFSSMCQALDTEENVNYSRLTLYEC